LSKPGGHGVIWKLAHDKGIFKWFFCQGRKGATVRQVRSVIIDISSVCFFNFLVIIREICFLQISDTVGLAVMLWQLQM
jgi:hypothetical protein